MKRLYTLICLVTATTASLSAMQSESKMNANALLLAAADGNVPEVGRLLELGTPVDVQSEGGHTPLLYAVVKSHEDVVSVLLSHGADYKHKNHDGVNSAQLSIAVCRDCEVDKESSALSIKNMLFRQALHDTHVLIACIIDGLNDLNNRNGSCDDWYNNYQVK